MMGETMNAHDLSLLLPPTPALPLKGGGREMREYIGQPLFARVISVLRESSCQYSQVSPQLQFSPVYSPPPPLRGRAGVGGDFARHPDEVWG